MKSRGFTIAELMISLAIFSLVATGTSWLVLSASRAQTGSAQINGAQNAVRAAMTRLRRDIQAVSAGVSSGMLLDWRTTVGTTTVLPIAVNNRSDGPDEITLLAVEDGLRGMVSAPFFASTDSLFYIKDSQGISAGVSDVILVSDLTTGVLLQLSGNVPGASTADSAIRVNTLPPTNPLGLSNQIKEGSYVFHTRWVTYSIDSSTGTPLLMLDPDGPGPQPPTPIAEGVEDMQFELGFDLNGNGIIEKNGAAANDDEWVYNVAGETPPATLAALRQVSVVLIARTLVEDSAMVAHGEVPRFGGDRAPSSTTDHYLRRAVGGLVTIRSFNL